MSSIILQKPANREDYLVEIEREIEPIQQQILNHKLYSLLTNKTALEIFLEHHIFAVWDFMSLVKSLQQKLTCNEILWLPSKNRNAARLINEIVLAEESDQHPHSGYISHFELYLEAMEQLGASTERIKTFIKLIDSKQDFLGSIFLAEVPIPVWVFMMETLSFAMTGSLCEIAAYFVYGRENLIPDLFPNLIENIAKNENININLLRYYLERHVEIDGEEHQHMARQILSELCGEDPQNYQDAKNAAIAALKSRFKLWDAITVALEK